MADAKGPPAPKITTRRIGVLVGTFAAGFGGGDSIAVVDEGRQRQVSREIVLGRIAKGRLSGQAEWEAGSPAGSDDVEDPPAAPLLVWRRLELKGAPDASHRVFNVEPSRIGRPAGNMFAIDYFT